MLYSLAKILLLIFIVVLLASGLAYLLDAKDIFLGEVQATISGTEYTLSPLQAVLFLVALTVLIWIVLKLLSFTFSILRFINGDDTACLGSFLKTVKRRDTKPLPMACWRLHPERAVWRWIRPTKRLNFWITHL